MRSLLIGVWAVLTCGCAVSLTLSNLYAPTDLVLVESNSTPFFSTPSHTSAPANLLAPPAPAITAAKLFKPADRKSERVVPFKFGQQAQRKSRTTRRETTIPAQLDAGLIEYGPENVPGAKLFLDALRLRGLADGEPLAIWPDLSGHGNDATQPEASLRLTYHPAEVEDGLPYVAGSDNTKLMNVPLPATATKTIFVVARLTVPFASGYLLKFDTNNHMYSGPLSLGRWGWYKKRDAQGTTAAGYYQEWTVLCVRQDGNSISFFVDGKLVETLTPESAPTNFTKFTLGPGPGRVRQLVMFDRVLTDAEIARHILWLRKHNRLAYRYEYLDTVVSGLSSPALIVSKDGFKGARPLVMLNHAAGYTERMYHDLPGFRKLLFALLDEGYIVASSALTDNPASGYASWGNPRSLDANVELYNCITGRYSVDTNKVAMVGTSMGGLTTLLAFADARIPVKGAALYSPVTNLAALYADKKRMAEGIRVAYDIAEDGSDYALKTVGHDPNLRAPSDWTGKRLRFYGGHGDTVVPWHLNAEAFAARVRGTATEADIIWLDGDHAANVDTTVADLLAFMRRCFN